MSFNDPISDMLTRIRNATWNRRDTVDCRNSRVCRGIAQVLKDEGYINDYAVVNELETSKGLRQDKQGVIRISLKYGPFGEQLINGITRHSKPGRRVYAGVKDLPKPMAGLGISVISTPKGVLSNRKAVTENVGGEVLCVIE